jgi:hypothetical protein
LCAHDIRVATGLKHQPESYATRASIYEIWSQLPCRGARTIRGVGGEKGAMTVEGSGEGLRCHSDREPAATLAEAISRLPVRVSVPHTGAHPDDENNAMRS